MNQISQEIIINDQKIVLETGKIARQANGSVLVSCEGTTILATVAGRKEAKEGQSFFPLSVNYQEKTYAAGKIPGGFFKREGRPSEKETLISRLIDRPLRPSFPDDFLNEIQVTDKSNLKNYAKDIWISTKIKLKILKELEIIGHNYNIETVNKIVYIIGIVDDENELQTVVDIAKNTKGVIKVINYVKIQS